MPEENPDAGDILRLKDEGNQHFKAGQLDKALDCYTHALKLGPSSPTDKATLLKNRAAVYLKKEDFKAAEVDATKSLEIVPNDPKALFRRSQAREEVGNISEAFQDAKLALHYEPGNKALLAALQRLATKVQEKQTEASTTGSKVHQMLKHAFDANADWETKIQAMNNLVILARESSGSTLMWQAGVVDRILGVIRDGGTKLAEQAKTGSVSDEDTEYVLAAQRALDELAKDEERANNLLSKMGHRNAVRLANCANPKICDAATVFIQRLINALSGMNRQENKQADADLCEKNKVNLVSLLFELKAMLTDPTVCAIARNNIIDTLLKNLIHIDKSGLPRGWSWRFVEDDGLERLLKVACCIPEHTTLPVTKETREHLAICLSRLNEDMIFDRYHDMYKKVCETFIKSEMEKKSSDMPIRVMSCITTMLLGPFDIGFSIISNQGITELMLEMAESESELLQSVAVEAIVHTASKRDRCSAIIAQGIPILRKLYASKNDHIKARALVGLCKCASSSGGDVSRQPMAEGSTLALAKACKKFLLNPSKDADLRRWAADGLAFLTIDADVKDWLVQDPNTIRALVELSKQAGPLCVFGIATIFVNLTNAYDKPEITDEMKKLAEFSKHHVPEEHAKDQEEFVHQRVSVLVKEGATAACYAIGDTKSGQSQELLARALNAFVKEHDHRGTVVQEGGAKLLLRLAHEGPDACKCFAAQGIARIAISINPEIAFPGQRIYEAIKPLIGNLHVEIAGLVNYEALLALTNITSISDSVRKRVIKDNALYKIEEYWFMQDHDDLRAAATECLLNLMHNQEAFDTILRPGTDRLKLWVLYAGDDEDERLSKAATGALVMITQKKELCIRISQEVKSFLEIFEDLLMREDAEIQNRGALALLNMVNSDYDVAAKLMQSKIFEVLVAITKLKDVDKDPTRQKTHEIAVDILKGAEKLNLIKATDRELAERLEARARAAEEHKEKEGLTIEEVPEDVDETSTGCTITEITDEDPVHAAKDDQDSSGIKERGTYPSASGEPEKPAEDEPQSNSAFTVQVSCSQDPQDATSQPLHDAATDPSDVIKKLDLD